VPGDVLRPEEVGVDQTDDQLLEDADILDSDSDVPLLGLGLGETEPAEKVAPLGPEPASLLPEILPGEPEPVEEVALLALGSDKPDPVEKVTPRWRGLCAPMKFAATCKTPSS
jgi:hypothetical protein